MGTAPILMAPKKLKANSGESGKTNKHPVLDFHAELLEGVAGSVNFLEDFLVGKFLILIVNRRALATPLGDIIVHKGRGGIVNLRQVEVHGIL